MAKIIIGIDPDSKAHGVAVYEGGKLTRCCSWELSNVIGFLQRNEHNEILFCIENVCEMSAVFRQRLTKNNSVNMKMSNSIGRCQQSQIELERIIIAFSNGNCEIRHFKISEQWKNQAGKKIFEKITGWTGRSNEDTRSAAYFGFLGLNITGR